MNKILIFISEECSRCKRMLKGIKKAKIPVNDYELQIVDAMADEEQDFCDQHKVDELPHIKVYKNGELIFNMIGVFDPEELRKII